MDGGLQLKMPEIAAAFASGPWADRFPPILTADQAAELLQVPKATIYAWSSRKLLRGCGRRVGKRLLFFRDRLIVQALNKGLQE
jgi:hypothetical protein